MTTNKFRITQLLLKINARRLCKNNQQKRVDCLKPRSNKNELECKNCGCNKFYVRNYQSLSFVIYCPFHNVLNGSTVKN